MPPIKSLERIYLRKWISEPKLLRAIIKNAEKGKEKVSLAKSAYQLLQLGAKTFMEKKD